MEIISMGQFRTNMQTQIKDKYNPYSIKTKQQVKAE